MGTRTPQAAQMSPYRILRHFLVSRSY